MAFGFAGAAAGASDELQGMLAQKRAKYLGDQDLILKQAQSARADQELQLQRQEAQQAQAQREQAAKLQNAQIAVSQASPGQELTPDVAASIQGTPYAARLNTQQSLPSSTIPLATGMPAQTTAPKTITTLRPTQAQEKEQGQETARRQVVDLFKRGAPKNQILGALADAGETIPPAELLKDPDRELQDRLTEIKATGDNAARVATIGANARESSAGDALVKVEHKDPTTGKTVIEWLPKSQLRGQKFEKGNNATTENRLASADAVNQTGDDIIKEMSDPAYAAKVGPEMGRYNTLRDFIGNPPPEYSELAGQIESYALANMGVHGMRSAQGAQKISDLLDKHHTPQSLVSTINGLSDFSKHFMANEGRATSKAAAAAPSAGGSLTWDPVAKKWVP